MKMVAGRLAQGLGTLTPAREDKRNIVKPVTYLNYGGFSSYAPSYDSTFSNLTKEDSDLVISAYGSEAGVQYAESIMNFAKDSDYLLNVVDNLLDTLTDGEHSKTMATLKQAQEEQNCTSAEQIDFKSLRSLSDLGIDVSFLENLEPVVKQEPLEPQDPVQSKLDATTELIEQLDKVQNERLSRPLPGHLSQVMGPTPEEYGLAEKVTDSLIELSKQAAPEDLVSVSTARNAMGITTEPVYNLGSTVDDRSSEADQSQLPSTPGSTTNPSHASHEDLDDIQEFLQTGPELHVADSPTTQDDNASIDENMME
jgi:bromodomain-containing protein 7/9